MKKQSIIAAIIVTIVLVISLFIKTNYFFNPLSLKSDEITHLSWWHYKKPILIEFNNKLTEKSYEFTEQDDIAFIFEELKNSHEVTVEDNYIARIGEKGKHLVPIANLQVTSNQKDLGTFFIYEKKVFKIEGKKEQPEYWGITDDLWDFLNNEG